MPRFLRRRAAFVVLWRVIRSRRRPHAPGAGERMRAVPRMVATRIRGRYREVSWTRLALILGGLGYVVSPVDVAPELLLALPGLVDDTLVLAWVVGALLDETERFLTWERDQEPADAVEQQSQREPDPWTLTVSRRVKS